MLIFRTIRINAFVRGKDYEDSHKIVDYTASFNTSSKLEFNIFPDNKYLDLGETLLKFAVEIPSQMVPGNDGCCFS